MKYWIILYNYKIIIIIFCCCCCCGFFLVVRAAGGIIIEIMDYWECYECSEMFPGITVTHMSKGYLEEYVKIHQEEMKLIIIPTCQKQGYLQ